VGAPYLSIAGRPDVQVLAGDGPWRLGRSPDADVAFLTDPGCSRQQARIARQGDGFLLEPLSANSPTFLDGRPLSAPAPLRPGATITFAAQRVVFGAAAEGATVRGRADAAAESFTTIGTARGAAAPPAPERIVLDRTVTIGRAAGPDQVVLDHPSISRRHAVFERRGEGVVLRDLGSTNGSFVNGVRVVGPRRLAPGDRIDIGPVQFSFDGSGLSSATRAGNAELVVEGVSRDVRAPGGAPLRILDRASLTIRPRTLTCIMGASGSGKSTLMNILAGRARPSEGSVKLNGIDLHANFAALKQDVAFVPQQDVLHEQLTLRQALTYAARLRLPPDTSWAQLAETVAHAAQSVDLTERLDTKIGSLSGGQKKRASLASEILNRPSVLFLDEVTSGLDEATDWEIMRLLRRLAEEGMTIVAVTHTLANVEEFCHEVVCMGRGGHLTFAGAPADALRFFGTDRLGGLFRRMEEGGPQSWRGRFEAASALDTLSGRAAPPPAAAAVAPRVAESWRRRGARMVRQFFILTDRNIRLLLADRRTLTMAASQSVLIGGLMGYAFGSFGQGLEAVNAQNALLLLLGLCAIWLGCNSASKDIVGELTIYRRERDINLSTFAFVGSKYCVSAVFTMVQLAGAYLLVALFAEGIPGYFLEQLGLLLIGAASGTAMGLVISASANTRDQATTIVPMALVPQLILAGVLVPKLPAFAEQIAKVAVSGYWLTEAMKSVFIAASGPIRVLNPKTGGLMDMTAQPAGTGAIVVSLHAIAFFLIAWAVTLWRNGDRRQTG
jgi:ABC-type multidrug transport system ATPase subunit/pSer/pThr/pTyr-binding forkhead associated (FHA) protein